MKRLTVLFSTLLLLLGGALSLQAGQDTPADKPAAGAPSVPHGGKLAFE